MHTERGGRFGQPDWSSDRGAHHCFVFLGLLKEEIKVINKRWRDGECFGCFGRMKKPESGPSRVSFVEECRYINIKLRDATLIGVPSRLPLWFGRSLIL